MTVSDETHLGTENQTFKHKMEKVEKELVSVFALKQSRCRQDLPI
jgi:hypothetical protein